MSRKYWTKDETIFLIENYKLMTYQKIATHLNRTLPSIEKKLKILGLGKEVDVRKAWTKKEINFIDDNYPRLTFFEIGKKLNRTPQRVRDKAIKYGWHIVGEKPKYRKNEKIISERMNSSFETINRMYGF